MQPNIEILEGLERRIDLTIPAVEFNAEVHARLGKLARDVRLPGFRKGKVPMKMVAASYGPKVQSEVLSDQVMRAFDKAVVDHKLRVAVQPRIEAKQQAEGQSGELIFSATFEVYPDIPLSEVVGLEIKRATCPVDDAAIDRTIEIMRKQRTIFEPVARAAEDGDKVILDFVGTLDGVPFEGGSANDFEVVVGAGRLLPDFEKPLVNMKAGDKKTFPLTFPDDYSAKDLAGKQVQFEVTVQRVEKPVLPEVDEAFAKSLGVEDGDLTKMREEIKSNLEREVENRLSSRTRNAVMESLVSAVSFEPPKGLVAEEAERLAQAMQNDLQSRGVQTQASDMPTDLFSEQAQKRIRLGLLVGELVRVEKLQASQGQIRQAIERIAQGYQRPEEVIQWFLQDRERLSQLENRVIEDNVVSWVLSKGKVVDEPIAFDELMGNAGQ